MSTEKIRELRLTKTLHKMEQQVHKHKEKQRDHRHRTSVGEAVHQAKIATEAEESPKAD
jgi:hypothetical protein